MLDALREAAPAAGPIRLVPESYRETRSVGMLVLNDVGGGATRLADDLQGRLAGRASTSRRNGPGSRTSPLSASGSGRGCSRRYPSSGRSVRPMPLPTILCCGPVERSISLSNRLPWEGDVSGSRASSGRRPRAHRAAIRQRRRHEDERPRGRFDRLRSRPARSRSTSPSASAGSRAAGSSRSSARSRPERRRSSTT